MTRETLDRIHERMASLLAAEGTAFDAVYSHTGTGGPDDYPPKPDPGMIFAAAERFALDLRQSWLIGDADRDIAMAVAAGWPAPSGSEPTNPSESRPPIRWKKL